MPGSFLYAPHQRSLGGHRRLLTDGWGVPIDTQRKEAWEARIWHCAWLCAGCLARKWQRPLPTILRALHLSQEWPIQAGPNTPMPYQEFHTRPAGRRGRDLHDPPHPAPSGHSAMSGHST